MLLPVTAKEDELAASPDIPILSKLMVQTLCLVPIEAWWKRPPQRSFGNSSSAWLFAKSCSRSSGRLHNRPFATRVQTVLGYRPTSPHLDSDYWFAAKLQGRGSCPCKRHRNGTQPRSEEHT